MVEADSRMPDGPQGQQGQQFAPRQTDDFNGPKTIPGTATIAADLFTDAAIRPAAAPLTVFRSELIAQEQTSWEALFEGFTALKGITFSSSIEFLMRLADRLEDIEIVFGAEGILSREHLALLQASQSVQAYGFADALADQKALVEALARLLGRSGRTLIERVAAGTLRFRLLRGRPATRNSISSPAPPGTGSSPVRPI